MPGLHKLEIEDLNENEIRFRFRVSLASWIYCRMTQRKAALGSAEIILF